jgi:hypothetical protein
MLNRSPAARKLARSIAGREDKVDLWVFGMEGSLHCPARSELGACRSAAYLLGPLVLFFLPTGFFLPFPAPL